MKFLRTVFAVLACALTFNAAQIWAEEVATDATVETTAELATSAGNVSVVDEELALEASAVEEEKLEADAPVAPVAGSEVVS